MALFAVATPGLEAPLADDIRALGHTPDIQPGGIGFTGGWADIWRANLRLRGATRILARIGAFPVPVVAASPAPAARDSFNSWRRSISYLPC